MNRSYSKIRHIQNINMLLEYRLLNEEILNLSKDIKVMIFQSFYNWWRESKSIIVDGVVGENTNRAINEVKEVWVEDFEKGFSTGLKEFYLHKLNEIKNKYISDLKELNNINNARILQVMLCLTRRVEVIPDGIIGTNTKTAMREELGSDNIIKVDDSKLKKFIDKAISNVTSTSDFGFNVSSQDIKFKDITTKSPSEKSSIIDNYSNNGEYDAIFVAGDHNVVNVPLQLQYFKNGFGKDKNVATFLYTGTPYGHKKTIAQVLAENPKIPVFLFSAGVWRANDVVSNGNTDLNKVYIIHPHGANKSLVDKATSAGLPIENVFVSQHFGHGSNIPGATRTSTDDHMAALTEVAEEFKV